MVHHSSAKGLEKGGLLEGGLRSPLQGGGEKVGGAKWCDRQCLVFVHKPLNFSFQIHPDIVHIAVSAAPLVS